MTTKTPVVTAELGALPPGFSERSKAWMNPQGRAALYDAENQAGAVISPIDGRWISVWPVTLPEFDKFMRGFEDKPMLDAQDIN